MVKRRKRKRKLSIKKTSKILIPIIIIIVLLINKSYIYKSYLSHKTNYSMETIETIIETENYNDILNEKYSKTLENIINTKYYNQKYLSEYPKINYIEDSSFLENISKLLSLGYTSNDINSIYSLLNNDSITIIINNDYIKDITNFINLNYFKEENLTRYINYLNKTNETTETIVTNVNIGLDNEYYTNIKDIEDPEDILVLVNKYHALSEKYVPNDLENINSKYGSGKLKKEAKEAFEKMCEAAKLDNIKIYSGSAYRSYSYQKNLYNRYVLLDGRDIADTYSARAGHSEHQTGLALDILNGKWQYISKNDKEYTWLINNSYKYGFILRYPEGKEEITGYMYEEWHFRYLGIETATELHNLNITYDEYIAKKS